MQYPTLSSLNTYTQCRGWLEAKFLKLPNVFAIDIAAYAIMSSHYHVVLHINAKHGKSWSDKEIAERWTKPQISPAKALLMYALHQSFIKLPLLLRALHL